MGFSIFSIEANPPEAFRVGDRSERVLTASLPVPPGRLHGSGGSVAFYRELLERAEAVPGVLSDIDDHAGAGGSASATCGSKS
jgi:hypothetical protein